MKHILMSLVIFTMAALFAGCQSGSEKAKLPAEDIDVLTVYAKEIAVLHNPNIPAGSREKYEAAKKLAEEIDFSFTRNVRTLDNIFSAVDAMSAVVSTTSQCVYFRYTYQDNQVEFSFMRSDNTVTSSEVKIK